MRFVVSALAAGALVVFGATSASAAKAPLTETVASAAAAQMTVTVSTSGNGWVTSDPAGISCGTICLAKFPAGTAVFLTAQAAAGSLFSSWSFTPGSYSCNSPGGPPVGPHGRDNCQILPDLNPSFGDTLSIDAVFSLQGAPCVVPGVTGKTLAAAKRFIKISNCKVGKLSYAFSKAKGRVVSQNPKAGWRRVNGKVDLIVSRGKR
jgi:PASTA domain